MVEEESSGDIVPSEEEEDEDDGGTDAESVSFSSSLCWGASEW